MRKISISLLAAVLCLTCAISMSAQSDNVLRNPEVRKAAFAVTPPLRDLVKTQPIQFGFHEAPPVQYPKAASYFKLQKTTNFAAIHDPVAQNTSQPATVPTKLLDFLGVGTGFFGYSVPDAPTDGNLSIGDNQIVQWVNVQFAVFDLNGNNLLFNGQHFVNGGVLFTGLPHCGASNSGDIIAQWDKIAHRWVMYQPRFSAPYYDCFAISQTPDATGAYYTYEFAIPTFQNKSWLPDYPHMGIWPNGYYLSHNGFGNPSGFGVIPCAYDRVKMLAGDPAAGGVCFLDQANNNFDDSMLPADLDDANASPGAIDPLFMGSIDNPGFTNAVYYYPFHFDTNNYANSTFSCVGGTCSIPVANYTLAPNNASEPGGNQINTLSDRLMYRLAYRILPAPTPSKDVAHDKRQQEWLVSHAVANNGVPAVRWYEFRSPTTSTSPTTFQQGTYAPDGTSRFMSSLARDKAGNIAMSYTASSSSVFPTIAYTGRAPGDALGTMGAEQIGFAGTGSQTDTSNRWGDYYDMALSNDGCTFVTTGEYYTTNSSFNWSTRIIKLKFDNCNP